jgi:hypothetical protein
VAAAVVEQVPQDLMVLEQELLQVKVVRDEISQASLALYMVKTVGLLAAAVVTELLFNRD